MGQDSGKSTKSSSPRSPSSVTETGTLTQHWRFYPFAGLKKSFDTEHWHALDVKCSLWISAIAPPSRGASFCQPRDLADPRIEPTWFPSLGSFWIRLSERRRARTRKPRSPSPIEMLAWLPITWHHASATAPRRGPLSCESSSSRCG